jgi:arginyl-tRNA synthetase
MTPKPSQFSFIGYIQIASQVEAWRSIKLPQSAPDWQTPSDLRRGILSSNLAFRTAKVSGKNPVALATELLPELNSFIAEHKLPLTAEAIGPYLNLRLAAEIYPALLTVNLTANLVEQSSDRIMLEYIGANVAKRLHAGHMRNLNIGDALRRILGLKYPRLITDNHWGDWGVQFGVLLWAYKQNVNLAAYTTSPKAQLDELQRLYVWGNAQEATVPDWATLVRDEFVKLEKGDAQNRALWEDFVAISKKELAHDLELFGVPATDLEQGESFYEADMASLRKFMDTRNLWHVDGKARYIDYEELAVTWPGIDRSLKASVATFGRCYLISSNGYTTYAFRDVAARLQWARDHKIDRAITVTDKTQAHNFNQAFALICYLATLTDFTKEYGHDTAARLKWDNLVHIGYGFLQLASGKMSTRLGNVLGLPELVGEVCQAAAAVISVRSPELPTSDRDQRAQAVALASLKWADLNRDPLTDVTLDPEAIIRFEGNTGTYQLYTYARLRNVLRRAGYVPTLKLDGDYRLSDDQCHLLDMLYTLPSVVKVAAAEYRPNLIASYVYDLSDLANRWYVASPKILELAPDDNRRAASLHLIDQVTKQLAFGLSLLGIKTVEEL